MRRVFLGTVVVLSCIASSPVAAQQEAPGIIVVSQQKCENVGELNDFMRANLAPILNEMVAEGRLLGWGVLGHAWGDEWNHVIYYSARDLTTFEAAFGEAFSRLTRAHPNAIQLLEDNCSGHRDNIYRVVMTDQTT